MKMNTMRMYAVAFLVAAGLSTWVSCTSEKTASDDSLLLKVSAENLEGLNPEQWPEVKEMDGKKVRTLLRRNGIFVLPAWWGSSARPGEGDVFVLEIDYKDVVSAPFIVSSFGNCENSVQFLSAAQKAAYESEVGLEMNTLSELHRIPGENTSEWKTAAVPVSWDYLYAGKGNPGGMEKQVFGIRLSGGDENLPVSEIRVRKATKEDEVRYNAETRAWIKESQQKYGNLQAPASDANLPEKWKSKNCIPYVRNYLSPILPGDIPDLQEMETPMKVRMALNEMECKQLGVYANGENLQDVSIGLSELKNKDGKVLNAETKLYTAEYAFVKEGRQGIKPDAQRIWPLFATTVQDGNSQAFWLTFETKKETALPGIYRGELNIEVEGKTTVTVPLEIEVMPVTLLTMEEAGLSMGGCVTGFVPFHNISYAVKNNVNAFNSWFTSVRPAMSKVDGKMVLDFTLIDEWMKNAKRLGWKNTVYFLGGNPYGFPRTMNLEKELFILMQDEGSREERLEKFLKLSAAEANRGKILEEIRGVYAQWVKEVTEHARANGWPELILTPFDEPAKAIQKPYRKEGHENDDLVIGTGPWIRDHFIDGCEMIRNSAAPGTRIYGSIHHDSGIEFLPYIDVFCTNAIHLDNALGDKVRAGGSDKDFWQYTGVGAGSEPARMRYSFGYYFGAFDSRGSLLWAYNWGNHFDTTEGYNWMICWDTPFGTIPSLSFEGLREAWDDRRYIETLKKTAASKGREDEARSFLNAIFKEAVYSKTEGGEDTVDNFWNEINDMEKLDEWRYAIADKIVEMSKM